MAAEDLRGFFTNEGLEEEEDEEYIHPPTLLPVTPPPPEALFLPPFLPPPQQHCPHHHQQCCSGHHAPPAVLPPGLHGHFHPGLPGQNQHGEEAGEEDVPAPAGEEGAGTKSYNYNNDYYYFVVLLFIAHTYTSKHIHHLKNMLQKSKLNCTLRSEKSLNVKVKLEHLLSPVLD